MTSTARSLTFHESYGPASDETTTRLEARKLLRRHWFTSYREQYLGIMLAACGVLWFADSSVRDALPAVSGHVTPLQVSALGMIAWLHGKYRRSIRLDK